MVAIMVLAEDATADAPAHLHYRRQIRDAARISHANLVTIHDCGHEDGVTYVAMELLEGEPLSERLQRGPLSWSEAVKITRAVAEGLAAAHRQQVIHRDIKPANIFFTADGEIKILGLGLARHDQPRTTDDSLQTGCSEEIDLVDSMSPEQVTGEQLDARTDIFSLGCVLYEMLTSRKPFRRSDLTTTLLAIVNHDPPSPSELGVMIPATLELLLQACLEKERSLRVSSAEELATALDELLFAGKISDKIPVPVAHQRHRYQVSLIALGAVILASCAVMWSLWSWPRSTAKNGYELESLAVMPLKNLMDQENDALAEGLTEAIVSELTQISSLQIIAPTAINRSSSGIQTFEADGVLDGTVNGSGERVRITIRLDHNRTGRRLLTRTFENERSRIWTMQTSIASDVAREILCQLTPQEQRLRSHEVDMVAQELYLKGRVCLSKRTAMEAEQAADHFTQAIARAPDYAQAHAGLADALILQAAFARTSPQQGFERARAAATRAVMLDPLLAEAHTSLGIIRAEYDWDWSAAEYNYRQAITLNRGYSLAHQRYALLLAALGRFDEAISHGKEAQHFNPLSLAARSSLTSVYYLSGSYQEAADHCQETIRINPDYGVGHGILALCLAQQGHYDEATEHVLVALELLNHEPEQSPNYAHIRAMAGDLAPARQLLARKDELKHIPAIGFAQVHVALGDHEQAIDMLEQAHEERFNRFIFLAVDPVFRPLHEHPRFQALTRRMGLDRAVFLAR
jgi:serine/threonine protein kinase/tetratricopeptide (TPR) repeat protein